ncbi:hypothetical protein M9H77_31192 [Catharanthus roseus]|uniref:Uncharacterized protein n=1 Tax=Catharanthus roseus TaxID=4058 RepID=A0ACC0A174_CATRO|nr:hypothetical protein M9H77_31192 [Catharanthus roseus]
MLKRRFDHPPYVTIGCECGEGRKKKARLDDNDKNEEEEEEEEEVLVKYRGLYGMKKCNCIFQLRSEKSTIGEYYGEFIRKNSDYAVSKQTIYNTLANMKEKRMEGRNTKYFINIIREDISVTGETVKKTMSAILFLHTRRHIDQNIVRKYSEDWKGWSKIVSKHYMTQIN